MDIKLEIKGSDLVISLYEIGLEKDENGDLKPHRIEKSSASLSLETIRHAMNGAARSRYKSELPK